MGGRGRKDGVKGNRSYPKKKWDTGHNLNVEVSCDCRNHPCDACKCVPVCGWDCKCSARAQDRFQDDIAKSERRSVKW